MDLSIEMAFRQCGSAITYQIESSPLYSPLTQKLSMSMFPSVSWAEEKLVILRVGIPSALQTVRKKNEPWHVISNNVAF